MICRDAVTSKDFAYQLHAVYFTAVHLVTLDYVDNDFISLDYNGQVSTRKYNFKFLVMS